MSQKKVLKQGDTFARSMDVSEDTLAAFERISGDSNRLHRDEQYAKSCGFRSKVSYGNILGLMVSSLVGMNLAEYEVLILAQMLLFRKPVYPGDTVTLSAEVSSVSEATKTSELKLTFRNGSSELVASGTCQVRELL